MTDISNYTLQGVENQLKSLSEELAALNLEQNNVLTRVDELTTEIETIKNKCEKKKQQIDQENKDKMLIHEKLIAVERTKTTLEKKILQAQVRQPRKASSDLIQQKAPIPTFQNQEKGEYQPPTLQLSEKKSSQIDEQLDQKQILQRIRRNFETEQP